MFLHWPPFQVVSTALGCIWRIPKIRGPFWELPDSALEEGHNILGLKGAPIFWQNSGAFLGVRLQSIIGSVLRPPIYGNGSPYKQDHSPPLGCLLGLETSTVGRMARC